jgi:hypothetical protein
MRMAAALEEDRKPSKTLRREETGGWLLLLDVVQLWTNPMREERIGSNSRIGVQLRVMLLLANFM